MEYLIDGYNLLFRRASPSSELEKSRTAFIAELELRAKMLFLDITLVFDGRFRPGEKTLSHFQSLRILFSAFGETADELILDELRTHPNPREVTVVTSDRELARMCKQLKAHINDAECFLKEIDSRYKKKIQKLPIQEKKTPIKKVESPTLPIVQEDENLSSYYQEIFEKRFIESGGATVTKSLPSDYERWLKAFMKNLEP